MNSNTDIVIAGAGIVGLTTAYQIKKMRPSLKVKVLEKEAGPALHQTGRNSGVVHTGVYYKPGSLKAKNCIEGRKELLHFCNEHTIAYQKKQKLIVATDPKEFPRLREIYNRGKENGVPNIRLISQAEVKELEPNITAIEALLVPECHIIDYKKVASSLCNWILRNDGEILFNEPVFEIRQERGGCKIIGKKSDYQSRFFINCTGLFSDRIAKASSHPALHQIIPFRGEYYEIASEKQHLVQSLIYPVPNPNFPFLGVHLTPMICGKLEAGPNAILALAREGYRKKDFNWKDIKEFLGYPGFWKMAARYWKAGAYEIARSFSKELFLRDLRRFAPSIDEKDLIPGGIGIRAQVVTREGKLLDDFSFCEEGNSLHVLNAPSPAATASFAIGQTLAKMAIKGLA